VFFIQAIAAELSNHPFRSGFRLNRDRDELALASPPGAAKELGMQLQ
jgi:hypothetical protein